MRREHHGLVDKKQDKNSEALHFESTGLLLRKGEGEGRGTGRNRELRLHSSLKTHGYVSPYVSIMNNCRRFPSPLQHNCQISCSFVAKRKKVKFCEFSFESLYEIIEKWWCVWFWASGVTESWV